MQDQEYAALKRKILQLLKIDLDAYKVTQMRRRVETFVKKRAEGAEPLVFVRRLESNEQMLSDLREWLTINVSEFFRDEAQYEILRNRVMPELLARSHALKIWSAGCSGGQEPYSFAIMIDELGGGSRADILATDLDREILSRAQAGGPYVEQDLRNVSAQQLETYFEPLEPGPGHRLQKSIARRVHFKELNLLSDPYPTGFDLVACRNVLIYFEAEHKAKVIRNLYDALKPGGVLFIGASEALLGSERDGLERLGGNFYRKDQTVAWQARAA